MNTAPAYMIQKFGGQSALARLLGKRPSTVQHWSSQGVIPAKWHAELLRLAKENRVINIQPRDFIEVPESAQQLDVRDEETAPALPIARFDGSLL